MTYEMTLFFRQFWIDPRLAWSKHENGTEYKRADNIYNVAADMVDLLWIPDSFFIDEIGTCIFILSGDPWSGPWTWSFRRLYIF